MESCWRSRQAAIPRQESETTEEQRIYRHVLELEVADKQIRRHAQVHAKPGTAGLGTALG
jgi:hypothetical protein